MRSGISQDKTGPPRLGLRPKEVAEVLGIGIRKFSEIAADRARRRRDRVHAAGGDLDAHFASFRRGDLNFFDRQRFACFPGNGGSCYHRVPFMQILKYRSTFS